MHLAQTTFNLVLHVSAVEVVFDRVAQWPDCFDIIWALICMTCCVDMATDSSPGMLISLAYSCQEYVK